MTGHCHRGRASANGCTASAAAFGKAAVDDATLRLVPQDHGSETSPIQVFLREHIAGRRRQPALAARGCLLAAPRGAHRPESDVAGGSARGRCVVGWRGNVSAPTGADTSVVAIAGPSRRPLRAAALDVRARPNRSTSPNLNAPKLNGAEEGPCLWTITYRPVTRWTAGHRA